MLVYFTPQVTREHAASNLQFRAIVRIEEFVTLPQDSRVSDGSDRVNCSAQSSTLVSMAGRVARALPMSEAPARANAAFMMMIFYSQSLKRIPVATTTTVHVICR
jgi:hypothetical protein